LEAFLGAKIQVLGWNIADYSIPVIEHEEIIAQEGVDNGGAIWIDPDPDEISAPWELVGPGGSIYSGEGDQILSPMPAGAYSLTWQLVEGYYTPVPNPVPFELTDLSPAHIQGTYSDTGCQIAIFAPSAGTTWNAGESSLIKWQKGGGCSPRVNLRLLKGGNWVHNIAYNLYGNSYDWDVTTYGHEAGSDYQIRVHDDESQYNADSPFFTIETSLTTGKD